jgi:hypothetical protein
MKLRRADKQRIARSSMKFHCEKNDFIFGLDFTPMMLILIANVSASNNSNHTERRIKNAEKESL